MRITKEHMALATTISIVLGLILLLIWMWQNYGPNRKKEENG